MSKSFYGDLMRYYREDDSVRRKVVRAVPTVDEVNGELVGSLWVDTDAPLTAEEQAVFCAYITGQYSDGWGEGFEQREIDVGDGKLYVHFWQDHDFELKRDVPDMTEFKKSAEPREEAQDAADWAGRQHFLPSWVEPRAC